MLGCLDSSHARPDCDCQSVSSHPSPYAYLKAHITRSMAFLSISHMPFLSLGSNHLPNGSIVRARSSQDVPANSRKASTLQSRQLYLRYLHLHPASQITERMPKACFLYTSTRSRTQSPLRTVVIQDRVEKIQPYVRTRRRIQDPNQSFIRDALSDASSSQARIFLLPSRRSRMLGSQYNDVDGDSELEPRSRHVRFAGSTQKSRR